MYMKYIATTLYTYFFFMYVCSLGVYEKPWVDDKDGRLSDYIIWYIFFGWANIGNGFENIKLNIGIGTVYNNITVICLSRIDGGTQNYNLNLVFSMEN